MKRDEERETTLKSSKVGLETNVWEKMWLP